MNRHLLPFVAAFALVAACASDPASPDAARSTDAAIDRGVTPVDGASPTDSAPPTDGARPIDAARPADASTKDGPTTGACPAGKWCSALYPPSWTPGSPADSKGRALHDFSYAGYKNGLAAVPLLAGAKVFDAAKTYGADNTGNKDATAAIQKAIDAAAKAGGGVVLLPAGTYRCDGVLNVRASGIVIRGAGKGVTKLHFTKHKGVGYAAHLTFRGAVKYGKDVPLAADGVSRAMSVRVATKDAATLKVGDEVDIGWVITPAFVTAHKMANLWTPFYNKWKPIFRRTIVAIDTKGSPAKITVDVPLRYAALRRDKASLRKASGYLSECGIEKLSVSNAVKWADAWAQNQVHAIELLGTKDCWVRDVHSIASPSATGLNAADRTAYHLQSSGVLVRNSKRVTVTKTTMQNPQHRGGGGNGYLIHVRTSNEVLVVDSEGRNGRHNLIQNWDFGTTGCVFLRSTSVGSTAVTIFLGVAIPLPALSEYHHALAMANLVDSSTLDDGWAAANRGTYSSGAGHTATECVFWNNRGKGLIRSMQWGWGYVIGTAPTMRIETSLSSPSAAGSGPQDFVEGAGKGATLWPSSLYEHQLARRKSAKP